MSKLPPIDNPGRTNYDSPTPSIRKKKERGMSESYIKSPEVAKHPKEENTSGDTTVQIHSK